jgi:hypothetical protein
VLLELRRSVGRHPGVSEARGHPPGQFTRVRADLDPDVFGGSASSGTLTIRWFVGESQSARPEFSFHYSEEDGFDCGWHYEPNPHVSGWAHYQERESASEAYDYQRVSFGSTQPVRVLWEVLERLEETIQRRESED